MPLCNLFGVHTLPCMTFVDSPALPGERYEERHRAAALKARIACSTSFSGVAARALPCKKTAAFNRLLSLIKFKQRQ